MIGLSAGLAGFYLVTRGLLTTEYCDAIAPGHIAFFAVAAAGTYAVSKARRLRKFGLLLLFGLVGAAAAGAFAIVTPGCLATPFARLDPLVDAMWYRKVAEGQPLFAKGAADAVPAMIQMLAALGATVALYLRAQGWTRRWWRDYVLLLLAAIALSLMVARSLAFASILAAIPLGWLATQLLDRFRRSRAALTKEGAVVAVIVLLAPTTPVMLATRFAPSDQAEAAGQTNVADPSCLIREEAVRLGTLPQGTVFAPLDIGPTILLKTEHAVVATGHHRAEQAMADIIRAFTADEETARQIVATHNADYIATVRQPDTSLRFTLSRRRMDLHQASRRTAS